MNAKLIGAVALLVGASVWLVFSLKHQRPAQYVAHQQWRLQCLDCATECSLSTEEMHAQIKRGEASASTTEERRFKCPKCGKVSLVTPRLNLQTETTRANP
jgi:anaerobic selenocysteine-containing dehydrogenase